MTGTQPEHAPVIRPAERREYQPPHARYRRPTDAGRQARLTSSAGADECSSGRSRPDHGQGSPLDGKEIAVGTDVRSPGAGRGASDGCGLHGHPFGVHPVRTAAAEAIGTFFLVLVIVCTAVAATLDRAIAGAPYGSLAVPLAGGLTLMAVVAALGPVSGAHLNPAVTLGLALNRRFPWNRVPGYLAAQFAGAIGAALTVWALYGDRARATASLGATYPAVRVGAWQGFATEAIATFLLVAVVVAVAADARMPPGAAAVAIGSALAAAIAISGPLTGAGINPARAIGPMIVAGRFTGWWAYLAGPVLGGAAAVAVYEHLLRPARPTGAAS